MKYIITLQADQHGYKPSFTAESVQIGEHGELHIYSMEFGEGIGVIYSPYVWFSIKEQPE
jgi:hypothetical protein